MQTSLSLATSSSSSRDGGVHWPSLGLIHLNHLYTHPNVDLGKNPYLPFCSTETGLQTDDVQRKVKQSKTKINQIKLQITETNSTCRLKVFIRHHRLNLGSATRHPARVVLRSAGLLHGGV